MKPRKNVEGGSWIVPYRHFSFKVLDVKYYKILLRAGMVAEAFNLSTQEAQASGVSGQPGLQRL